LLLCALLEGRQRGAQRVELCLAFGAGERGGRDVGHTGGLQAGEERRVEGAEGSLDALFELG